MARGRSGGGGGWRFLQWGRGQWAESDWLWKKQNKKTNNPAGSASACAHLLLGVDGAVFQGCVQGPLPLDVLQGGLPVGEEAHPLGAAHVVAAERGGAVSQR